MDSYRKRIMAVLPAAAILLNVIFQMKTEWLVDSDMAQEMCLADHLNQTGSVISKNWVYTTEIRVLNTHCFFRAGLFLFPDNWHYARIFGAVCVYILLLAGMYLFMKAAGKKEYWMTAAAASLMPVSTMYWFLGLYGLCYVFYGACILLMIYAVLRKKRSDAVFIAACAVSFLLGTNGIKMLLLFYAPLAAVSFCTLYAKQEKQYAVSGLILSGCSMAGTLVNHFCFGSYHFTDYGSVMLTGSQWSADLSIASFINKWLDLLTLFGYQGGVKLVSFYGIASLLSFIPASYAVFLAVRALRTHRETEPALRFAEMTVLMMLVTDAAAFTLLKANYNSSYWIPAFICIIALMVLRTSAEFSPKHASQILCIWFAVSCFLSAAVLKRNTESPLRGRFGLQEAAEWLKQSGYTTGYAQFWDADAAVEMTDGSLDIYALESMEETDRLSWGQSLDHFQNQPEGPVFLLVRKGESHIEAGNPVFENECYSIFLTKMND